MPENDQQPELGLLDRFSDELENLLNTQKETRALWIELPEDSDGFLLAQCFNPRSPMPVAGARLHQIVTAIDAVDFWALFSQNVQVSEDESEEIEAWIARIEFCDTLLVRGLADLPVIHRAQFLKTLSRLQLRARILDVDAADPAELAQVLSLTLYSPEETSRGSAWRSALDSQSPATFRAKRPFHPQRLHQALRRWPMGILRACGQIWLASRNETAISLSLSGPSVLHLSPDGPWIATLPREEQRLALEEHPELGKSWDPEFGDRGIELAFISEGQVDLKPFMARLESCLLTDLEMRSDWSRIADPFPAGVIEEIDESLPDSPPEPEDPSPMGKRRLRLVSSVDSMR